VVFEKGRVLVVDDDRHILEMMKSVLSKEGYKVTTANSGEIALRTLESETPDTILLDIKMPGMDGFETLKAIKQKSPEIPVIMLTAFGYDDELVDKALKMGAAGYIAKDMPLENILSTFDWVSEKAVKGKLAKRGAKIVLAEAEKRTSEALKEFLEKNGYKVHVTNNCENAVSITRKEQPDMILLDVHGPGMSGIEALGKIREFNRQVKVMMMSLTRDEDTRKKCESLGACDYLTKPFTPEFLLAKINEKL